MSALKKGAVTTPVQLYRHLMRCVRKLPQNAQPYYSNYVRQGFRSHADEIYPERIQEIIDRAIEDAQWVLKKYCK